MSFINYLKKLFQKEKITINMNKTANSLKGSSYPDFPIPYPFSNFEKNKNMFAAKAYLPIEYTKNRFKIIPGKDGALVKLDFLDIKDKKDVIDLLCKKFGIFNEGDSWDTIGDRLWFIDYYSEIINQKNVDAMMIQIFNFNNYRENDPEGADIVRTILSTTTDNSRFPGDLGIFIEFK